METQDLGKAWVNLKFDCYTLTRCGILGLKWNELKGAPIPFKRLPKMSAIYFRQ